jgi:hypothetical protein
MPTRRVITVAITYQGATLHVDTELFMHILNCASNRASEAQMQLEQEPLDWGSPLIDVEFANRKQSIRHCQETVELARRIKKYLKENAKPCR